MLANASMSAYIDKLLKFVFLLDVSITFLFDFFVLLVSLSKVMLIGY